jgi:hypothetical protein
VADRRRLHQLSAGVCRFHFAGASRFETAAPVSHTAVVLTAFVGGGCCGVGLVAAAVFWWLVKDHL